MADRPDSSDSEPVSLPETPAGLTTPPVLEIVKDVESRLKDAISPQQQSELSRALTDVIIERREFFCGPQPPPELLKQYDQVCPGWAAKLLQMGIDEQKHRHERENRSLDQGDKELALNNRDATYSLCSLILGFIAFLVIALLGFEAMRLGHEKIAIALFGTFSVGVIGAFIQGRPHSNSTKSEKTGQKAKLNKK